MTEEDTKQVKASGNRKPPRAGLGRPKGTQNKTTALLKDAILKAASQAGGKDGIVGYLAVQAAANPGPFMSLLGKVLPLQVTGKDDEPIKMEHAFADEAKRKLLAAIASGNRSAMDGEPNSG